MARTTHGGEEIDRSVYSTNYTEFSVKKKADATILLTRLIMLLAYAGIVIGLFLVMWFMGAIAVLLVSILWYFTWPFTQIEYEYVISSGDWKFEKSFGSRRRTTVLEKKIKDMEIIAPYDSANRDKCPKGAKIYDFRASAKQTEDIFFAVFEENGQKSVILFQCTNKAQKILKSYNKENTVTVETLRY